MTQIACLATGLAVQSQPPSWVNYPGEIWEYINPADAGLNVSAWNSYANQNPGASSCGGDIHKDFPDGRKRYGAAVQRGGYLLTTFANGNIAFNSASVGKAFNGILLQLAIDKGLITGNEHVKKAWPGSPSDCGSRSTLSNLFKMQGGFARSNGYNDGCSMGCASGGKYSSHGMWRLMQALTYIFDKDLKDVLDEELFSKIGIKPQNWYFMAGKDVYDNIPGPNSHPDQKTFYPKWTASNKWYGCFIDAPYKVNGHWVRGGGGWVCMAPKDLARIGHLMACNGWWKGKKLITKSSYVTGHAGCGDSDLNFSGKNYTAWGKVTTKIKYPAASLFTGSIKDNPRTSRDPDPVPAIDKVPRPSPGRSNIPTVSYARHSIHKPFQKIETQRINGIILLNISLSPSIAQTATSVKIHAMNGTIIKQKLLRPGYSLSTIRLPATAHGVSNGCFVVSVQSAAGRLGSKVVAVH